MKTRFPVLSGASNEGALTAEDVGKLCVFIRANKGEDGLAEAIRKHGVFARFEYGAPTLPARSILDLVSAYHEANLKPYGSARHSWFPWLPVVAGARTADVRKLLAGVLSITGMSLPKQALTMAPEVGASYTLYEAFCDQGADPVAALCDPLVRNAYSTFSYDFDPVATSEIANHTVRYLEEHDHDGVEAEKTMVCVSVSSGGHFRDPFHPMQEWIPPAFFGYIAGRLLAGKRDIDDPAYTPYPLICHAIKQGDRNATKCLLELGADPTWWSRWHGNPYLTKSCGVGREILAEKYAAMKDLLLEAGMADQHPGAIGLLMSRFECDVTDRLRSLAGERCCYVGGRVHVSNFGAPHARLGYGYADAPEDLSRPSLVADAMAPLFFLPEYEGLLASQKFRVSHGLERSGALTDRGRCLVEAGVPLPTKGQASKLSM